MVVGWNFISSPLLEGDLSSVVGDMSGLVAVNTDQMKSQRDFTLYIAEYGWFGNLETVSPLEAYKVRLGSSGDFVLTGIPSDPTGTSIDLDIGWNWLGWPSMSSQPIEAFDAALQDPSLLNTSDEVIKSQYHFTSYIPNFGWFGELTEFEPGKGYQVRVTQANRLVSFGAQMIGDRRRQRLLEAGQPMAPPALVVGSGKWQITPTAFEYSMCIVAAAFVDGIVAEDGVLAAFVNGQLRGVTRATSYLAPVGAYKGHRTFNLMVYGNKEAEGNMIKFQYHHDDGPILSLTGNATFAKDAFIGSLVDPFVISSRR